jgi:hypothetical protein
VSLRPEEGFDRRQMGDIPPIHAASYILELAGFNDSRETVSQRLDLTSTSMVPAALLTGRVRAG